MKALLPILPITVFVIVASAVLLLLAFDTQSVQNKKDFWITWCTTHLMYSSEKDSISLNPEQCAWMWDQRAVPQQYIEGEFYGEPARLAEIKASTPTLEPTKKEKTNGKTKSR